MANKRLTAAERAVRVLPCKEMDGCRGRGIHGYDCPAYYHSAVAATIKQATRELEARVRELEVDVRELKAEAQGRDPQWC